MLSRQTVTQEELGLLIKFALSPSSSFTSPASHLSRLLDEGLLEQKLNGLGLSRKGRAFIGQVHATAAKTGLCTFNDNQETSSEHRVC